MTFSSSVLAPGIHIYEESVNFTKNISDIATTDTKNWNIKNQEATSWQMGDKIVGYDEYPINFNFLVDEKFLLLGKKIFDCALDYSNKNLTTINGFDYCILRKYSAEPGFLEIESSDVENPSRRLTAILFFDNLDKGGELVFKNFNISVAPQRGSVVIFPASFAYSFKINKPSTGDNFVLISHFI